MKCSSFQDLLCSGGFVVLPNVVVREIVRAAVAILSPLIPARRRSPCSGMLDDFVVVTITRPGPLYVRLKPDPRGLVIVNNFDPVPDDPITGCPQLGPVEIVGTVMPGDCLVSGRLCTYFLGTLSLQNLVAKTHVHCFGFCLDDSRLCVDFCSPSPSSIASIIGNKTTFDPRPCHVRESVVRGAVVPRYCRFLVVSLYAQS